MTSSIDGRQREIGDRLRLAREEAGLSVRDLATRTRIGSRHITALEEGDFASLQGFIFVRGFLVSICKELKKDPAELLGMLKALEPEEPLPLPPLVTQQAIRPRPERRSGGGGEPTGEGGTRAWLLLLFYLAVVAGVTALVLLMTGVLPPAAREEATPAAPALESAEEAFAPVVAPAAEMRARTPDPAPAPPAENRSPPAAKASPAVASTLPQPPPSPAQAPARQADDLRLSILATEKTWLKVQADDQPAQEMTLKQDDSAQFVAQDHFSLTIGNAGGLVFTLNGRQMGPPGAPGQVLTNYILNRDNL